MSMLCSAAHAQSATDEAAGLSDNVGGLEQIVVTAQKQETDLQRTPIAISVLGTTDLKSRGVQSLEDLTQGAVPSLRIAPFATRSSALTIGIRGIVPADSNQPARDTGVGVYIDGVYLGRTQGLGAALFDVERIEVLKGPQGTLFGRNATGGAVSIVSRKPSGEFQLTQTAGVSSYDGYNAETHLDLPRFANISLKFDGVLMKRDGTVDNPMRGEEDFNSYDRRGLHAQAEWKPSDVFTANYSFDTSHDGTTPYFQQLIALLPGAPALAPAVQLRPKRTDEADVGVPEQESIGKTQGHALHMNWFVAPRVELRSITAYRDIDQSQYDDGGAHLQAFRPNSNFSRYSLAFLEQHQISQEFQVVGNAERLNYVAGVYYFHEHGEDSAWTPSTMVWNADGTSASRLPQPVGGPNPDRASTAITSSRALFGQVTWTPPILDDRLHATAGARYTKDRKEGELTKLKGVDPHLGFDFSSSRVDPAATVAFDITDGANAYVKWGTAYRAGGANSRSYTYRSFGPEEVETAELGVKTEFWSRRARLNAAVYHSDYRDMQIDFSNPAFVGSTETTNTDQPATLEGLEFDATIQPIPHLTLGASYAYTSTDVPDQVNPFTNIRQRVNVIYTPKNAMTATVDYDLPLSFATLHSHLDANAADGYYASSADSRKTDSSLTFNGRIALSDIELQHAPPLQIAFLVKNLTNEQHLVYAFTAAGAGLINGVSGFFNDPRTYQLEASVSF
jgi:iron complex outermembrane receptor protein